MSWNQRQDPRQQQNWSSQPPQQQSTGYGRQQGSQQSSYQQNPSYGQGQSTQSYNQPYVPTVQTQTGSYGYNDNQNQGQYYPSAQTSNQPQAQSSYYSQQSSRGPTQSAQPVNLGQQQRYNPTAPSAGLSQQQQYNPTASSQYMPSSAGSQQQQYNPSAGPSQQYNPRTSQPSATQGLGQYGAVTSSGAQSSQQGAPNLNNLSQILSSLSGLVNLPGGSNQQSMPSTQPSNVMSGGLNLGSSNTSGLNSLLRGVQQQQQPQQQVQLAGNLSQLLQQSTSSQAGVTPQQQNQALQLLTAQLLQQQQQQQNAGYKPPTQSHMSMPSRPMGAPVASQPRFNSSDRGFTSGPPQRNPAPSMRGRSSAPAPRADFGGRGGHRSNGGRDFDRERSDRDRNDRGRDERKRFDRDTRDRDRPDRDRPVRTDRDRNDRDRPYRRSKSPEHKRDKSPPPKPRDKTPPKTIESTKDKETSHTDAPKKELTEKDKEREREKRKYECKISAHEINSFERDYASTRRRYENLYITPDFAKSVSAWLHSVPLEEPLPLDHHVPFTCDNEFREITDPVNSEAPALQADHTRWFAKVMLLTGYSADDYDEIMDADKLKDLTQKIKFIVQRQDRSQLMLLGGEWEPAVDGDGDPAQDATLIPAAIRHVREQLQLDLSQCTRWYRFLEIHYHRVVPNTVPAMVARDITVIYVPAVWDLIPSMEDFMNTWEQREYTKLKRQKDKEERARLEREKIERERLEKQEKERAEKEKQEKECAEKEKQEAAASETTEQDQHINLNQSADQSQSAEPVTEPTAAETSGTAATEQPAQTVAETKHESEPTSKSESEIVVDKSKAPKDVTVYLNTKREKFLNRKTAQLSLDGLLDYDYEGDRWEPTFEVSLFAENFHEMLQRDFGHIVLQAIMSARPEKQSQDKKRRREDASDEERAAKKPKTETKPAEGSQTEQTAKAETSTTEQHSEASPAQEPAVAVAVEPKSEDVKTEETERKINYSLKFAFEFFDRNRTGYLKSEDVETMFHALGFHVSKNQMHAILNHQLDTKHRLFYKNLLFAEENTEQNASEPTDGQDTVTAPEQEQMDLNA